MSERYQERYHEEDEVKGMSKQYVGASSEPMAGLMRGGHGVSGPRTPTPSEEGRCFKPLQRWRGGGAAMTTAVASLQGMSASVMEMAAQLENKLGPILAQVPPTTGGGAVQDAPPSGSSEHVMSLWKVCETLNMTRERLTTLFERIEV